MGTPLPPWPQLLFDEWRAKNAIRHQVTNGDEWQMPFVASRHQEKIDKPNSSPNDERRRTRKPFDTKWRKATNEKNVRHQMTNGDERKKALVTKWRTATNEKKAFVTKMTKGDERKKMDSPPNDERRRKTKTRFDTKWRTVTSDESSSPQ